VEKMQKWEYCELELTYGGGVSAQLWFYQVDGKHKEERNLKYGVALAKLGLQGWEVVAASTHAAFGQAKANTISYIFKRPIKE
jgi:hypothetical protein